MVIFGWLRRATILGAKFDECRECHVPGPHLLIRKTHWFTLFWVPVMLLWVSHGVMCPNCGDLESVSILGMRRALRSGRLPLGRGRPGFEAAVRDHLGGSTPADWEAFGLAQGATEADIRTRWRQLAKELHPDAGGDAAAFVAMQAIYNRLLQSEGLEVGSLPDPGEIFDPVVVNPRKGAFDFYSTKLWPAAVILLLVAGGVSSALKEDGADWTASDSGVPALSQPVQPASAAGTAHTCWYAGTTLNGCEDDATSAMLFGTRTGSQTVCWFVEPLAYGEYADCR